MISTLFGDNFDFSAVTYNLIQDVSIGELRKQ
jgi:hypothetical protein